MKESIEKWKEAKQLTQKKQTNKTKHRMGFEKKRKASKREEQTFC